MLKSRKAFISGALAESLFCLTHLRWISPKIPYCKNGKKWLL